MARTWIAIGGAGAVALAAVIVAAVALWPRHAAAAPPRPVSTVVAEKRACLLSDAAQPETAALFVELQQAANTLGSLAVRQSTLPTQVSDAAPQLAGLIQQRCTVIVALGPLSVRAAEAAAAGSRSQGTSIIVATDEDNAAKTANVTTLPLTGLTADRLTESVNSALG
jgi:hypothetical protein